MKHWSDLETWVRGVGHEYYPGMFASPAVMQGEITANYKAVSGLLRSAWGGKEETSVVASIGQVFGKDGFAAELYGGDLCHADGRGVELAAMVLFNTIYGEFIEEKTTYAEVLAAYRIGVEAPRPLRAYRIHPWLHDHLPLTSP